MATDFVASSSNSPSFNSSSLPLHESPHHNPCAQCGQRIAHPSWSEGDEHRMAFIWSCDDCGYEFMTIAMYPEDRDHKKIAA